MQVKEEALEVLEKASVLLKEPELANVLQRALYSKTNMTWLDVAQTVLPIAIESVENSKVILPGAAKNEIVTEMVLPLIKDKLPWYIKPFAAKLLSWIIDLIVGALNKLFTKDWGKNAEDTSTEQEKAEGTI